jgi:hypothetical protein
LMGLPLYVSLYLTLAAFNISSLFSIFNILPGICLGEVLSSSCSLDKLIPLSIFSSLQLIG